ncbi:GntR family transcriptional regulator [Streptomyces sp. NPDC058572]|uniref:GntR family transcriptional regulator n=1 Tax=Streptomyces sp. NPDC058572 TaxID=3346546 RepID=UPI00364C37DB
MSSRSSWSARSRRHSLCCSSAPWVELWFRQPAYLGSTSAVERRRVPRVSKPTDHAYDIIAAELRARIESGELPAGAAMPSESQLCREFGKARGTVRRALQLLEEAGLTQVDQGQVRRVRGDALLPHAPYEKVAEALAAEIAAGARQPGDKMPSAADLAAAHGVSLGTAQRALKVLENRGLLKSGGVRGRLVAGETTEGIPASSQAAQLASALTAAIRDGKHPVGSPLPGERQIAEAYGVARVTVQSALARLAEQGLIERQSRGRARLVLRREA